MRYGPQSGCLLPSIVLALLAIALGSTPFWLYTTEHPIERWYVLGIGLLFGVGVVCAGFKQRGTEVEAEGIWEWYGSPLFRKLTPKADFQRVVVLEGSQADESSSWTVYRVSLEGPRKTVQLARNFDYKTALKTAAEIGGVLGLPVEDRVLGEKSAPGSH